MHITKHITSKIIGMLGHIMPYILAVMVCSAASAAPLDIPDGAYQLIRAPATQKHKGLFAGAVRIFHDRGDAYIDIDGEARVKIRTDDSGSFLASVPVRPQENGFVSERIYVGRVVERSENMLRIEGSYFHIFAHGEEKGAFALIRLSK